MMSNIKDWIKRYRWVIIITILFASVPIALNFILLFPSFTSIVGNNTEWLSFWSGYISAAVAFIILHIQRLDSKRQIENNRKENKYENEENRKLQFNILKYQQEMQWLNMFRQTSVEYVSAYTYNDLVHSINVMRENPIDAFNILGRLLERLAKCDIDLGYIGMRGVDKEKLYNRCASFFLLYNDVVDDVQHIMVYIINSKNPTFEAFCVDSTDMQITEDMKHIISFVAAQKDLDMKQRFNDVAMSRIKVIEERAAKIRDVFATYIAAEQKRIDEILTENLKQ